MAATWQHLLAVASLWRIHRRARRTMVRGQEVTRKASATAWRVRYRVTLPDGRWVERVREASSRQRAQLLYHDAARLEAATARGLLTAEEARRMAGLGLLAPEEASLWTGMPAQLTWDDVLDRYAGLAGRTPETRRENTRRLMRAAEWFLARGVQPADLTAGLVEEWLSRPGAARTRYNDRVVLARALDPFWGAANPARAVTIRPGPMTRLPRALTPDEDARLAALAWEHRHLLRGALWVLWVLYRVFGLRRQEALELPGEHVLRDRLLVQATGDWVPKGKRPRAVLCPPWHAWAMEELPRPPAGRLVPYLDPDAVSASFGRLMDRVGRGLTLHSLRHTAITDLLEHGWPVARVQAWAGHRHLATTERYVHVAVEGTERDLWAAIQTARRR